MRRLPRILVPVLALAAGCTSAESQWFKPGATAEQRERDKAECIFDSTDTSPGLRGPERRVNQDRYHRCLEARGYELKQRPASR